MKEFWFEQRLGRLERRWREREAAMSMATRTRVKLEKGESSPGAKLGRERGDHGSSLQTEAKFYRHPYKMRMKLEFLGHQDANPAPNDIMDQTATQRRSIRTGYHSIRNRLMVEKDEFSDQKFDNMMNDVDALHSKLQMPRRCSRGITSTARTNIDWFALGLKASAIMGEAHGVSTMLGPIDIQPKQRKVAAPRRRNKPADCTHPE